MSVSLYASVRARHPGGDSPSREVCGEGIDYEAAKAAVDAQIPPGWQVLGYSRWACQGERGEDS